MTKKFIKSDRLNIEEQYQKNLDDFHRLIETHVDSHDLDCITPEKTIEKIKDTLEQYEKAQEELIQEAIRKIKDKKGE